MTTITITSSTDQTKQTNLTDRNWLLNWRTSFESDSHFTAKQIYQFYDASWNIRPTNNSSLDSDDNFY